MRNFKVTLLVNKVDSEIWILEYKERELAINTTHDVLYESSFKTTAMGQISQRCALNAVRLISVSKGTAEIALGVDCIQSAVGHSMRGRTWPRLPQKNLRQP